MGKALVVVLLVLLAAVSGGCAAPRVDWYGDSRFTTEERAAIEGGEAWLAAHAGREPATFDWSYDVEGTQPLPHTIRRERGPNGVGECIGMVVGVGGSTVYLGMGEPNFRPEDRAGFAAHELAHCELGFVDGYKPGEVQTDGIMRVLTPMRWTEAEDEQLATTRATVGH